MIRLDRILDLVFPRKCVLCGAVLGLQEMGICGQCLTGVPRHSGPDKRIPGIDAVAAVWYYEDSVRESLHRYKFYGKDTYAEPYGQLLAEAVSRRLSGMDMVTWVPVSSKRKRERGYDQAELLAKSVARHLGVPARGTLEKIRHNEAQSGLRDAKSRRENVRGAYRISSGDAVSGKRILLVDDILTTGATAGECASELRKAGAACVMLGVVAAGREKRFNE